MAVFHPHCPLSTHLSAESQQISGSFLELGVFSGSLLLACLALSDAAEYEERNRNH